MRGRALQEKGPCPEDEAEEGNQCDGEPEPPVECCLGLTPVDSNQAKNQPEVVEGDSYKACEGDEDKNKGEVRLVKT